jgi:hypothetical protein
MRSSEEIKRLIIDVAKNDDRVRAILLNVQEPTTKYLPINTRTLTLSIS